MTFYSTETRRPGGRLVRAQRARTTAPRELGLTLALMFALAPGGSALGLGALLVGVSAPSPASADAASSQVRADSAPQLIAQVDDEERRDPLESRPLSSRYTPQETEEKGWYNSSYIFGMTRGVAGSTIAPAGKVPLFVLTVPLDIALFPFAVIGGLFG